MNTSVGARRERRTLCAVGCIVLLAAPLAAFADDTPLPIAEAVRLALTEQPLLDKFDARARAAREAAVSAAQLPDPRLVYGVQDLPVTGRQAYSLSDDTDPQIVVGVSQELPRAAKRRLRGESRAREADRFDDERALAARALQRDVANTWTDVWVSTRAKTIGEATLRDSELQQDAVRIALGAGRATQADLVMARVATARLVDAVAARGQDIARARATLSRWIGAAAERPLPVDAPAVSVPELDPDRVDSDVREHPEVAVAQARVEEADVDARLAEAALAPDWRLEFGYGNRREFSDMVVLKIGMDLPLFTRNRQDRDLASALAQRDAAEAERDAALRKLASEMRAAQTQLAALAERERMYREVIVPDTQRLIEASLAAWRAGTGSLVQVIDARRAKLDAELAQLEVVAEGTRRRIDLAYLSGSGTP